MIRAILFDFDGVLTTDKSGSVTTINYLSERTGLPRQLLWTAFAPFNDDLLYGRTSHAEIWPRLCQALGTDLDFVLLADAFESTPMNLEMLGLARSLRARYAVGIVTDNKKDRIDFLKHHAHLASTFSPIVVSAEFGSGKDGTGIFTEALKLLDVEPQESIFIDNSKSNLLAADALGINTIYFDDGTNDIKALAATLEQSYGVFAQSDT